MSLEYTGIVKVKGETVQVSEKFKKRDFVISSEEQWPQHISFQLNQDRVDSLDKINVGDIVTVKFGLNGREWKSPQGEVKYFNTLVAFSIVKLEGAKFKGESVMPTPEDHDDSIGF